MNQKNYQIGIIGNLNDADPKLTDLNAAIACAIAWGETEPDNAIGIWENPDDNCECIYIIYEGKTFTP